MERYNIRGGRPLEGRVRIPAAKNSVLPLMAAALLTDGETRLEGVPRLADVVTGCKLLEQLGAGVSWEGEDLTIREPETWDPEIPASLAGAMRGSVFYLAPVLAQTGRVTLPMPGGCNLGPRQIDIHLEGLCRMGAQLHWHGGKMTLLAPHGLQGMEFTLRLPSVGATETLIMAAATAKGNTLLRGVACEPEIRDLAAFLNRCGANIRGAGGPVIQVEGKENLKGRSWHPIPDRIAAATYAGAAAIAGGRVILENCPLEETALFLELLEQQGCRVSRGERKAEIQSSGTLKGGAELVARAYPGFPTDMLPLAAAVLLKSRGYSRLTDTLFQNRFACADGFRAMGAKISPRPGGILIQGGLPLRGAPVEAPDLRGGAALLLAALGAEGTTLLSDRGHISRGYPDLPGSLAALGADISPFSEP